MRKIYKYTFPKKHSHEDNKIFEKNLDIKLINYKIFYGKYVIYESNLKVNEFFCYNDKLIFEGEYLNNKRNGKGKGY